MGFTSGGDEDVFASLVAAGKCDNVWAICMKEGSKSNGTITIGGVDERLSVGGKVNYVPDVGFGFHSVQVESITLTTISNTYKKCMCCKPTSAKNKLFSSSHVNKSHSFTLLRR